MVRNTTMLPVTPALLLVVILAMVASPVLGDETTHTYAKGEAVKVYANKIGPFNNPLESYAFFEMPGCPPASWEHKFPSLGQALAGDELYEVNTPMLFGEDTTSEKKICTFSPKKEDVEKWSRMVDEQYWYQLTADDLPMWATLGKKDKAAGTRSIYTHQHFAFGMNGDRIVSVNLTVDKPVPIEEREYTFTFSAAFVPSTMPYERRFERYLDDTFFEHRIHWFSIFNSFMMVLFLVGLVVTILSRTLRADYAKIAEDRMLHEEGKVDWAEDSGWKQLHADVFRVPQEAVLLCALIGTGAQLTVLVFVTITIAILSVVYTSPGSLLTYAVLAFAVTSYVAGYCSARQLSLYATLGPNVGAQWIRCMVLTATLFPGTVLFGGFLLNFVAIAYDSAQAIAFGGMVVMLLLWLLVSCPLVVMGTVVGRHRKPVGTTPATRVELPKVNQIPRVIPKRPWFRSRAVFIIGGGILPFGSIFIELYFVFTSFWNYKLYYVYGFMLLVFLILIIVTACVAVVCTYFQLNSEDHQWPWCSFALGASTAAYVFLYAAYFYTFKTKMTGFFMFVFYYAYMALLCLGIGIICGTIAFTAANAFVTRIFRNVKAD